MNLKDALKDGGFKSRKLVVCFVAMSLILLGFFISRNYPILIPAFSTYCGGILGAAALYIGGNSAAQYILTKNSDAFEPENGSQQKEEDPPKT